MLTGKGPHASVEPQAYCIRIKGHLDKSWSEWFDRLVIACAEDGTTTLTGIVADQPALFGLITKIRNLGLHLVSVEPAGGEPDRAMDMQITPLRYGQTPARLDIEE